MIVKSWFKFSLWNNWYKPSTVGLQPGRDAGIRNILIPNSGLISSMGFRPASPSLSPPRSGPTAPLNLILFKSNLFISLSHASRAISLGMVFINFLPLGAQCNWAPRGHSSVPGIRAYSFVSIIYSSPPKGGRVRPTAPRIPSHTSFQRSSRGPAFSFSSCLALQFWFNSDPGRAPLSSEIPHSGKRSFNLVINSQQLQVCPNLKTFILTRSVFNPLVP